MIKVILLFSIAGLSFNCSHFKGRNDDTPPPHIKSDVSTLEQSPESSSSPQEETSSHEKVKSRLGIILGPGSVKSFAHLGVLKELERAQLPISYIVGIEWGALIGGLYAETGKINDTDWKIYKLQELKLSRTNWLIGGSKVLTIQVYDDFFEKNLNNTHLHNLKIPFACPSLSIASGNLVWQESGSLKRSLEKCMPSPPMFGPDSKSSSLWMAALFSGRKAIDFLRKKGIDVIIYVDVLGSGPHLESKEVRSEYLSSLIWHEVKQSQANLPDYENLIKIKPNTLRFKLYDFSARSSLSAAGSQAAERVISNLVENYDF